MESPDMDHHAEICVRLQGTNRRSICDQHTSMHPPLHISKHPYCRKQIEALQECHESHAYSKFWGKCNQQKWDLDACLRKEKSINRAANFAKSLEEKARLQQKIMSKRREE